VFALGLLAGAISLIAVMGYWALGAQSIRWRWVRVIAVAVLALPIGLTILVLKIFVGEPAVAVDLASRTQPARRAMDLRTVRFSRRVLKT